MKKIILILFVLFMGVSSSFAYNNSIYVELEPSYSTTSQHEYVPLFANCEIHYFSEIGAVDPTSSSVGHIYLRHGDQYLSIVEYNSYSSDPDYYKHSDDLTMSADWRVLELDAYGANCYGYGVLEW